MFEDVTNWNRKRFRWRKNTDYCRRNCKTMKRLFLITIFLHISGYSSAASTPLSYNVSENLPPRTVVGELGDGRSFIEAEGSEDAFKAFDTSQLQVGKIVTKKSLDREHIQQYRFTLFDFQDIENSYVITVNVLDVNDNSPMFAQSHVTLEVSELASVGSDYSLGSAQDEDAPPLNVQGYRLVGTDEYFEIRTKVLQDGNTRVAELVVIQKLDRENTPFHIVEVEAYDGGTPTPNTGTITVNVSVSDSNDNSPIFGSALYNASISEGDTPGTDVITVKATDRDAGVNGDVTYSIDRTKSDPEELFKINSASGSIYINKKLDSETATQHSLTVLATDGGVQPQVGSAVVVVEVLDVNDNQPTIAIFYLGAEEGKVSEGADIGDYIARISVSDPDVGDVEQFNVTLSGGDGRFGLLTENNVVYLVRVKQKLDREETAFYDIVLNATDFGDPPKYTVERLTIEIEDINDNAPLFDQDEYSAIVSEESFPGTFVYHLSAEDADAGRNQEFEFVLEPSAHSDWFTLNSQSGLVTTAKYLDHEIAAEVLLTVTAIDFGTPRYNSSTTLVVTVGNANDSAPRFESTAYTRSVSEDIGEGQCFLQVTAIDPDYPNLDGQIEYTFAGGDPIPTEISLDRTNGNLCVKSSLDRETNAGYNFRVKAVDKAGQHAFARVTIVVIDVNDNAPRFHPADYFASLHAATSSVGDLVDTVVATDADDASGDGSGFGVVSYRLLSGNGLGLFAFDSRTGDVTIARPLQSRGDLTVELAISAVDGGGETSPSPATVIISIINSTAGSVGGPEFTQTEYFFTAREDWSSGSLVGEVLASAAGNAKVSYHLRNDPPVSEWFTIDREKGQILLDSNIDREIFSVVKLQVVASAQSPPIYGFCDVTVTIEDVNDNTPILHPVYLQDPLPGIFDVVTIPHSLPVTTEIYAVDGFDPDEGQNSVIGHTLKHGQEYFSIDSHSGVISIRKSLPSASTNYSVTVEATDQGTPSLSATATILIEVLEDDNSCPRFYSDIMEVSVPEDLSLSVGFYNITMSTSEKVMFRIVPNVDSYSFAVFPNGELYLTSKLDRETKDRHVFQITAESTQAHRFSVPCIAMATVEITVSDVNDNLPYFDPHTTQFTVKENVDIGTVVGTVIATDADIGSNGILKFSLANPSDTFRIDSDKGIITTTAEIDRETVSIYILVVEARDTSSAPLLSATPVRIFVEDENDNAPNFLYTFSPVLAVLQKKSGSHLVSVLEAVDNDSGPNGVIEYAITTGRKDLFEIDSDGGQVSFRNELDLDTTYDLTVEARDRGTNRKSSSIDLQVIMVDEFSNPSQFSETKYAFFPPVNTRPGDILGRFGHTASRSNRAKRETGKIELVNFYISEGNSDDHFFVDQTNGSLVVLKKPTYEDYAQFNLKVTAENSLDSADLRTFEAQINVQDTNDYSPTFSAATFTLTVREDSNLDTKIGKITATDYDIGQNGRLRYEIASQTGNSMSPGSYSASAFRIDEQTGELYTAVVLDREDVPQYILIVKATDGSVSEPKSSSVSVVITVQDVNDIVPAIVSRNEIHIFEDEPVGFPLLYVTAEDGDLGANGHIIYGISRQWSDTDSSARNFQIDPKTGLISLIAKLDFESAESHYLNVSATDAAALDPLTSYQLVTVHVIDINDQSPEFTQRDYSAEVYEDAEVGSLVSRVNATDGDSGINGAVTYTLHDQTSTFYINHNTGVITSSKELDRETIDSYVVIVYAHDGAFPSLYAWCTVEISVLDVNDNAPQFAFDNDGADSSTEPILATVSIPENENGPTYVYTALATDPDSGDNGNITFSITDGNTDDAFTINSISGEVWTSGNLDREKIASYRLTIAACDNGADTRKGEAYLDVAVVDFNDNDPKFTEVSYQAEISEELDPRQFVIDVHADDADIGVNGLVTYSIDPAPIQQSESSSIRTEGLFAIDPDTGAITTTASLDREKAQSHQFVVRATDSAPFGPRNSSVTVTVTVLDVNDHRPTFDTGLTVKNVSQNTPVGSTIATLSAEDEDSGENATIMYRISAGRSEPFDAAWNNTFAVDSNGKLRTTKSLTGGYTYYLDIEASDSGTPRLASIAVVTVNVVPFSASNAARLQFVKPTYDVYLSEGAKKNAEVVKIEAVPNDLSISISYQFHSGNDRGIFAINSYGNITVRKPELLDYETTPRLALVVRATGESYGAADTVAYTMVSISLTDYNDNAPVFEPDRYVTSTFEKEDAGMFVIQVRASDIDEGQNKEIRYYMGSGNTDESFSIDPVTGIVTTALTLDREIHDEYKLTVWAHDNGTPRQTSRCVLKITVVDKNDHRPTLLLGPSEGLTVSENAEVGKLITTATANDPDAGNVVFRFSPGEDNDNDYFTINGDSGRIHLAKSLDYETMKTAVLVVQASDGLHIDEKRLELNILDINDNAPVFDKKAYQASLDEMSAVNIEVVKIVARDADSGVNSILRYSIVDAIPAKNAFYINPISGVIYTNLTLKYDPHSSIYNLIIEATDGGSPPLSRTVPVRIEVEDINDHSPLFNSESYTASVSEGADRNARVINVSATDADFADPNRDVYYEITSGNEDNAFKINTLTALDGGSTIGEIRLADELDREATPSYSLTVTALDQGHPQKSSSAVVSVTVLDVNDNRPMFNQSSYSASIPEDASGEPVLMVFAEDLDSTSNLMFKISTGNINSAFEIVECDPPSQGCALISAIQLDYEKISAYYLSVQVWDDRDVRTSKSSVVPVTIHVLDVNEFSPYFSLNTGFKRVSETVDANQTVFILPGIDEDGGVYGEVVYTIMNAQSAMASGQSCVPADEMFYVVPVTGEIKTRRRLDYEECRKYSFDVKAENRLSGSSRLSRAGTRTSSYMRVNFEVKSVDEYPPVFAAEVTGPVTFKVPYGAEVGYVVGQVNATDADGGADGDITYEIDDEQYFAIDASTGVITLRQKIASGASHVVTITATSGRRSAQIFVTIEIEGAPAIAMEAQVLAIVFSVIAVVALIVVVVVCMRIRRNKKARSSQEDSPSQGTGNTAEFNDTKNMVTRNHAVPVGNGVRKHQSAEKQNHKPENGKVKTGNGVKHPVTAQEKLHAANRSNLTQNGHAGKQMLQFHNAAVRHSLSSGRGSEQDEDIDVDREVDRINSMSDTTSTYGSGNAKVKIRKKVSNQGRTKKQVLDSGIQRDMDGGSDISDGPNHVRTPSVESIHIFDNEGAGEEPLSIQEMPGYPHPGAESSHSKNDSKFKPSVSSDSNKSSFNSKRGSDGADSGYGRRGRIPDWVPEFATIAKVFSEAKRIDERETAVRSGNHNTFVMKDLTLPPSFDSNGPPPLITSVAEQRNDLVAPVPIITNRMQRGSVGNMPYHPHPQYLHTHAPQPSYLPGMYPKTPETQRSTNAYNSSRSQVAFNVPAFGRMSPSINSSQQGLSVCSLPRTPISHESSFTSPALSPALSPSLSPLATRSPSVSTVGDGVFFHTGCEYEQSDVRRSLSKSDSNLVDYASDFDDDKNERMVHV